MPWLHVIMACLNAALIHGHSTRKTAGHLLSARFELGINFFDTANNYSDAPAKRLSDARSVISHDVKTL